MLQHIKHIYIPVLVAVLLLGCKSLETKQSVEIADIPNQYAFTEENTALERPEWRKFFGDTILIGFIDRALDGNMELQMARQFILMNRAEVLESTGALRPRLTMGSSAALRRFGFYTMDGAGNASTDITPGRIVPEHLPDFYLGPFASWEIDVWGKLKNDKKADIARYMASIEGVQFFTTMLVSDIASNYAALLALDQELAIIRQMLDMQQQAVEIIIAQKEAGKANELALQQFNAQVLDSKALEQEKLQQIIEVENHLNFLMGNYGNPVPRGTENVLSIGIGQLGIGSPTDLLAARPDIREAELEVQATNFDLLAARRAFLPSFNFMGNLGLQAFSGAYLFSTPASVAYTALVGMAAPVLNLSSLKAQFVNANARQLHALYRYHGTLLNAYREVATEYANMQNLQRINTIKSEQAEILVQSVGTSTELYKTGRANYLEVLLAQQNALSAQLETVDAQMRQNISYINLYRALGGGWE